jgi:hypothetical protein
MSFMLKIAITGMAINPDRGQVRPLALGVVYYCGLQRLGDLFDGCFSSALYMQPWRKVLPSFKVFLKASPVTMSASRFVARPDPYL